MSRKQRIEQEAEEEAKGLQAPVTQQQAPATEPQPEPVAEPAAEPAAQEPTPAAEPAAAPQPTPDNKAEMEELRKQLAHFKHKAETVEGMLKAQSRDGSAKLDALKAEMQALKEQLTAKPETPPELDLLTAEEREAFKGGQLPPEARMAVGVLNRRLKELERSIDERLSKAVKPIVERQEVTEEERQQSAANARFERFMDAVERQVPNARKINAEDTTWHGFLASVDPESPDGATYGQLAQGAIARGDVRAVAALMREYQSLNPAGKWKTMLASQVRPDTSKASGTVRKSQQPAPWKRSELEAWDDSMTLSRNGIHPRTGKRLSVADSEALDRELKTAVEEGRIVPG